MVQSERMKKRYSMHKNNKRTGMAIAISGKIKWKTVTRNKGHNDKNINSLKIKYMHQTSELLNMN